jgi:hypothetical protein
MANKLEYSLPIGVQAKQSGARWLLSSTSTRQHAKAVVQNHHKAYLNGSAKVMGLNTWFYRLASEVVNVMINEGLGYLARVFPKIL